MIGRRSKIRVIPNIKRPTAASSLAEPKLNGSLAEKWSCLSEVVAQKSTCNLMSKQPSLVQPNSSIGIGKDNIHRSNSNNEKKAGSYDNLSSNVVSGDGPKLTSALRSPIKNPTTVNKNVTFCDQGVAFCEVSSPSRPSNVPYYSGGYELNKRRCFTGLEKLDPKTMKMADLIKWNPKTEQGLIKPGHDGKRSNLGRKRKLAKIERYATERPKSSQTSPVTSASQMAPQVRIGADGSLILDEESLTVRRENGAEIDRFETVEEGRQSRKVTSSSFKPKKNLRGVSWTQQETDLFFQLLSATGTDFSLMHTFFPTRSRSQLKNKYNREQRLNPHRFYVVESLPSTLDISLYDSAIADVARIEQSKQMTSKKRRPKEDRVYDSCAEDVWKNRSVEELQLEARQEIERLQNDFEQRQKPKEKNLSRRRNAVKMKVLREVEQRARRERSRLRHTNVSRIMHHSLTTDKGRALHLALNEDFPQFELVLTDESHVTITSTRAGTGVPVVNVPRHSTITVFPEKGVQGSHVVFDCPSFTAEGFPQQFVLQHEKSMDPNKTDFLHLFGSVPFSQSKNSMNPL